MMDLLTFAGAWLLTGLSCFAYSVSRCGGLPGTYRNFILLIYTAAGPLSLVLVILMEITHWRKGVDS